MANKIKGQEVIGSQRWGNIVLLVLLLSSLNIWLMAIDPLTGLSIPLADISNETERHVFVARDT